jgi:hypothetical protein
MVFLLFEVVARRRIASVFPLLQAAWVFFKALAHRGHRALAVLPAAAPTGIDK